MDLFEELKERHGFEAGAGFVKTALSGVRFFWSTETVARAPLIYNAGLVLILQGNKIGYLGDRVFHYNPDHYLVLSVPLPFDCETHATPDDPMLGLFVDIERADLIAFLKLMELDGPVSRTATSLGVAPAELHGDMRDAVHRLMRALCSDAASQALGAGILREILFHAIEGPHGPSLRALAQGDTHHSRVSQSIITIRENYADPLKVEVLARDAGMSVPVFHRAFKAITGTSPLQYLKATRLGRAKGFILAEGLPANEAARRVGYDNPSHFSREFKKHFGVSPRDARSAGYMPIDI
ncbi:AraC family transcriptional regulator [Celeribacter halophilus]|uniref:AraC family transcriptional regulator n=1 Tax=Celeribacter halophilus TaxID=576117 RepID=UPI001C090324|nr:AraC family transcriptional regulator [Celeribacter halophilus]MBU2888817.1 AraC family transcriptional regulator [Celeribacter halophilus]MDO6511814.1 AraC family transcriptional regulator [Celeribacter halophilus]